MVTMHACKYMYNGTIDDGTLPNFNAIISNQSIFNCLITSASTIYYGNNVLKSAL